MPFGLYQSLGIFIPLIVTNCIVVGRAEALPPKGRRCRRWTVSRSAWRYRRCLCWPLREILGNGTLFDGADSLLKLGEGSAHRGFPHRHPFPAGYAAAVRLYWPRHDADYNYERSKQRKARPAVSVAPSDVTGKA
ncbi:hypothetical protein J4734_19535 [Klebsiella pneumoniae]|uniref:Electron transport complex protein RnfE n=1 Tax=Klebsiella pneumoniae TaxID=573 RepID=A0A939NNB8_KLEPN|nr:hypothetical protein [Klebsiella pneumoniae]